MTSQFFELGSSPNCTLKPENSHISFTIKLNSDFIDNDWFCLTARAVGGDDTKITLEWLEQENSPARIKMYQVMIPRCKAELPFPISADGTFKLNNHFLAPYSALRKGGISGKPIKKEKIGFVKVTITSASLEAFEFIGSRVCTSRPICPLEGEPLIDRFGQRISGDWVNKIHSEDELVSKLKSEYERAKTTISYPEGWSKWGGWLKKRFNATGYFHIEHDGRRWWLADPDGYAFFSNGICYGERAGIFGFTDEYTSLHEWLPDMEGIYADAWSTAANIPQYIVRNGSTGADKRRMFNFTRANLIRAFGSEWHDAYTKITSARLHRMGFNTIGVGTNDYYDERTDEFLKNTKIPYVVTFRDFPLTSERIFRDFPDVFGDEYAALCKSFAERSLRKYVGDPYMIGYFVTNEPEWLFASNVNLTERLVYSDGCNKSKKRFIEHLTKKYDSIVSLNSAWNTAFESFDDLLNKPAGLPSSDGCNTDFVEFEHILVEAYGKIVSDAIREIDPNHLNLGMRYAYMSDKTLGFNLDYFDIFSTNCYDDTPKKQAMRIANSSDKPLMIGEWHIGSIESGLPSYGLRYTKTQAERRDGCRYYAVDSTTCNNIVGIHYFEYNDQPYFGRFDGECYNIGLVDVCQNEYRGLCDMFADFAKNMYPMLNGDIEATAPHVDLISI